MLNKIILMGRLTRSPEIRKTHSDVTVANFSLAVERDIKNKQTGERETDFIDCVAFGNTAGFVERYFPKGRMMTIEGRLQIRSWKDKEGNSRKSAEVAVDNVYFADSKREAGEAPVAKDNFVDIGPGEMEDMLPF